jgi:hypothetical protein
MKDMDYTIKPQGMICASADAESRKYRKVTGKSGRNWYIAIDSPAENVYISPKSEENAPGYKGFRGFGGRTLKFELEDGTVDHVKGPWASNTDSLFADTGVDVRDQHVTFGVISRGISYDDQCRTIMTDVIYIDYEPLKGPFDRIKNLAKEFANKEGKLVRYYSESKGGSITAWEKPLWMEIAGNSE